MSSLRSLPEFRFRHNIMIRRMVSSMSDIFSHWSVVESWGTILCWMHAPGKILHDSDACAATTWNPPYAWKQRVTTYFIKFPSLQSQKHTAAVLSFETSPKGRKSHLISPWWVHSDVFPLVPTAAVSDIFPAESENAYLSTIATHHLLRTSVKLR